MSDQTSDRAPDRPPADGIAAVAAARVRVALVLATSTGGVGRHVAAVARGLTAGGRDAAVRDAAVFDVAVFGPAATDEKFAFAGVSQLSGAVSPRVRFCPVEIGSGARPLAAARAALRLRRLTRGADVVHAHGLRAGLVSAAALGRWRAPGSSPRRPAFVVTLHNAMLGGGARRRVLELAMRLLARVADQSLAVSGDLVTQLARGRPDVERALVAAPARDASGDPAAVRAKLDVPVASPLLLAVGRLHPQKGFDVLIEAIASRRDGLRDAVTIIAGDGPVRGELERQVARAGVDVRLLGDRDDVADLARAADVVVMPSRWEGWPLAAAEALRAGRPFVATRVGGLPELVGDAALLVEAADAAALAAAIERVLGDHALAADLARRARLRAAELPGDDDVTAQLSACYQRILGSS